MKQKIQAQLIGTHFFSKPKIKYQDKFTLKLGITFFLLDGIASIYRNYTISNWYLWLFGSHFLLYTNLQCKLICN